MTSALTASGIWPAVWDVKNATAVVKARPRPHVARVLVSANASLVMEVHVAVNAKMDTGEHR